MQGWRPGAPPEGRPGPQFLMGGGSFLQLEALVLGGGGWSDPLRLSGVPGEVRREKGLLLIMTDTPEAGKGYPSGTQGGELALKAVATRTPHAQAGTHPPLQECGQLYQQHLLYLRAQVKGNALGLGLALGEDLQGGRGELSKSPPGPGLGNMLEPGRVVLRVDTCVCTRGSQGRGPRTVRRVLAQAGWEHRGWLCYLDDVNGQLTVAVAVQPLGSHIPGPALTL